MAKQGDELENRTEQLIYWDENDSKGTMRTTSTSIQLIWRT